MTRIGVVAAFAAAACLLGACTNDPATTTTTTTSSTTSKPSKPAKPQAFSYYGVGNLAPGSGKGSTDPTVWAPGITFPIKDKPAYLNSQVWGVGGQSGPNGTFCDARNYQMPWRDSFCETRAGADRESLNCPNKEIHQGDDIRAGDATLCTAENKTARADRTEIAIVAAEEGDISYVGTYTVDLRVLDHIYRYLHLNMAKLQVKEGDHVKAGQMIGYLSNDFGGTATTLHLHLELKQNVKDVGWTWVSPYMSLVRAYETKYGKKGTLVK
jgi:murein DD-endopeptidase MepM/ murein hydrolase activator NlpD